MGFKIIERIKFKLSGRAVPVIEALDVDKDGKVGTLRIHGPLKARGNSIQNSWDSKVWEIAEGQTRITLLSEKGITETGYVVGEDGQTHNLYTKPMTDFPQRAEVLGKRSEMDDLAEALDRGRSFKNYIIGAVIGMAIYAAFLGPMIGGIMV